MNYSDEKQVKLNNLDFAASGHFTCTIAIERPIYTKESAPVELTVIEKQREDPKIVVRKAAYTVGEVLELNCTSEPARPTPAVTWLLNGKEVSRLFLRRKLFREGSRSVYTSRDGH
ncbi:UNVERIFIED_CONTAM: hypothetical protein PYX00_001766 [Menopon gallinae]|uniref:Ig-like domain-containing protein n=1 Tax=Menopon gallinae TaxID=328185 RepID=A0AAW2IFI4_9NEOP